MIFGDAISTDGLGLAIARAMNLDEWARAVEMVSQLEACSPWWLGDLLCYGELTYGENYAQGIPEGLSPSTLKGYLWTAEHVPPDNRHPGLSWSHHRAVAALPPVEQSSLLDQAEAEGWSVRELKARAKGQEPTGSKRRVYHAEAYIVEAPEDGKAWVSFGVVAEDAEEIRAKLQAGKRVTLEP